MKKTIFIFTILVVMIWNTADVFAENAFNQLLQMPPGKIRTSASYNYRYYGNSDVRNQDTDVGMQQHDAGIMLPIIKKENSDFSVYTTFRYTNWDTKAFLSNTDIEIPNNVYNINFLPTYRYVFENGWMFGAIGQIGSASDKLFNSLDECVYGARVFLKVPSGERNAWMFLVDYSSNREFLRYVPLPGVGYLYNPNDDLQIFAGFPFAFVRYSPIEKVQLTFSYLPITTIKAKASYEVYKNWKVFADFNLTDQRYFRAGRDNRNERIFYYEKKAGGGLSFSPNRGILLTAQGGYSFDRYMFEAKKYYHSHNTRVNFDGAYYAEVKAKLTF
ncbi:MAG: hypothetical protein KJ995_05115 [Candidatus Omnitrophica bacterium]|nr:hypothetical protein [Candidatus Omnitrophota bacterium]